MNDERSARCFCGTVLESEDGLLFCCPVCRIVYTRSEVEACRLFRETGEEREIRETARHAL